MSEELLHDNPTPPIETLLNKQEHEYSGTHYVETASYQGHVHGCLCGANFMEREEVTAHITEELGFDPLDEALALCAENYAKLRASRDSAALRRVNQGTVQLLQAMGLGMKGAL